MAAEGASARTVTPALCCICQESLSETPAGGTGEVLAITCGHVYHKFCITRWFNEDANQSAGRSRPCPVCNKKVLLRAARKIYLQFGEEAREQPQDQQEIHNLREALMVSENSRADLIGKIGALNAKILIMEHQHKTQQQQQQQVKTRSKGEVRKGEEAASPSPNKRPRRVVEDVITLD